MYSPDFDCDSTPANAVQRSAELIFVATVIHAIIMTALRELVIDGNEVAYYNLLCINALCYYLLDCVAVLTFVAALLRSVDATDENPHFNPLQLSFLSLVTNMAASGLTTAQLLS